MTTFFTLTPASGHIDNVARHAQKIADAHPEHRFSLKFNDVSLAIQPDHDYTSIIRRYEEISSCQR